METLKRYGIRVAGVCGMFGPENDLSSNSGVVRQRAVDYIRRQLDLCHDVEGSYLLIVPGAVGRRRESTTANSSGPSKHCDWLATIS